VTIPLDTTSTVLRATFAAAPTTTDPSFFVSWGDDTTATFNQWRTSLGSITAIGSTTLLAAPGAGDQRVVRAVSLHNKDTVPHALTVEVFDGVTVAVLFDGTIPAGETLSRSLEGVWSISSGTSAPVAGVLPWTNTNWVDKAGDDGTALPDRADLPYLTVGAALGAAASGDAVIVRPGTYAESGLSVPAGVALIGEGGR